MNKKITLLLTSSLLLSPMLFATKQKDLNGKQLAIYLNLSISSRYNQVDCNTPGCHDNDYTCEIGDNAKECN